ncbi:MAG: YqcC family protein [Pseudomonas neustonica]
MNEAQWQALAGALRVLEAELLALGLWGNVRPHDSRLNSAVPFALDTLSFEEWLQWVFLPRMAAYVASRSRPSTACHLQPMGEEAFACLGRRKLGLLMALGEVDRMAAPLSPAHPIQVP